MELVINAKFLIGIIILLLFLYIVKIINVRRIKDKESKRNAQSNLNSQSSVMNQNDLKNNVKSTQTENFSPNDMVCNAPNFELIVDGSEMRMKNPRSRFSADLLDAVVYEDPDIHHTELSEIDDDRVVKQDLRRNIVKDPSVMVNQEQKRKLDMNSISQSLDSGDSSIKKEKQQSMSGDEIISDENKSSDVKTEDYVIF